MKKLILITAAATLLLVLGLGKLASTFEDALSSDVGVAGVAYNIDN